MKKDAEALMLVQQDNLIHRIIEDIASNIRNSSTLESAISAILERVVNAVKAEAGTFWFYHRFEDGRISPMAVYGGDKLDDNIYLLPGEGIAGQVIDSGETLFIPDCHKDARWTKKVDTETGFVTKTMLCVPLKCSELVFGCIQIINKPDGQTFRKQDLHFVEQLAEAIALVLRDHSLLGDYHSEAVSEERLVIENDARRVVSQQISAYMDPAIVHEILRKDGKHKKSLDMENITVFFADIRGFTHLAERLTPAQLISCLSDFLAITSQCIHRYGGIVDKFMGDCTMAYWRLSNDADAVGAACKAALAIQEEIKSFAARIQRQTGLEIGVGIGMHSGPALLCHVGDERYMAYTAIGDVVNIASRLEDNAPSGCIYISREVVDQLGEQGVVTQLEKRILLKGKQKPIDVWTLDQLKETASQRGKEHFM